MIGSLLLSLFRSPSVQCRIERKSTKESIRKDKKMKDNDTYCRVPGLFMVKRENEKES